MVVKQIPKASAPTFNRQFFGSFLKATRKGLGLSQPELASLAGVSTQLVSNLECGRTTPSVDTVCLLADALKISPPDVFGAGMRGSRRTKPSEIDRVIEILSRLNAREIKEAINILEALERLKGRNTL
jgi:transcriptional regulator with XRE-family HTH domain